MSSALTPVDLRFPFEPYDAALELKALEHMRLHLPRICPAIPARVTASVCLCGTAHNPGLVPLTLLADPAGCTEDWDPLKVLDELQDWVDRQDPQALRRAAEATPAPVLKDGSTAG